jgi:hypothetical protein
MRRMATLQTERLALMSLLEDYKVMCMSCNKPITSNPLRVPVPAKGNRPATEHMFHSSGIECAYAPETHYIHMRNAKHRGDKLG